MGKGCVCGGECVGKGCVCGGECVGKGCVCVGGGGCGEGMCVCVCVCAGTLTGSRGCFPTASKLFPEKGPHEAFRFFYLSGL